MTARAWTWAALSILVGCRSRPAEAGPQPCAPSTSSLSADASGERLSGRYRVQLVATSGSHGGNTAAGDLQLLRYESTSRGGTGSRATPGATYPLYGSSDLNLETVGAVAGELKSLDPARPGVLVIRMAPRSDTADARLILRLGAEANRQDLTRFDGAYTVLRVREVSGDGFAGDWESGAPMRRAGGHFCAVRVGDADEAP